LRRLGGLSDDDMWLTFNCGIGLVLVVDAQRAPSFIERFDGVLLGHVEAGVEGVVRV
jgi:phosphoribosylaminoimidazole (AIR) synthetase